MRPWKDRFHWWCNYVIPLVYDESLSYYEVLCKLTDFIQELGQEQLTQGELIQKLQVDIQTLQSEWPTFQAEIEAELQDMQQTLDAIKNGEYTSLFTDAIQNYIDKNLQEIIARTAKFVVFGLTMDGHFAVYIPEKWGFLKFSTITDPESQLYNHLVMSWGDPDEPA